MSNGANSNTSGDQVIAFDFARKSGSDQIPDNVFAEMVRRLIGILNTLEMGGQVRQPTEPLDHTLVWYKTNPVTGIPEGGPRIWSDEQNQWVDAFLSAVPYSPPREFIAEIDLAANDTTRTISILDMGRDDYFVDVEVSTRIAGSWALAVDNSDWGWEITGKTNEQLTIQSWNAPVGGLHFRVRCRNPQ